MKATDLISSVAHLPGVHRRVAAAPIIGSVEVAGIEVATAGQQDEAAMRRIWRERHLGATPLLLITDRHGDGAMSVLGPADGGGPVREIETVALEQLLRRVSTMSRLDAAREVAAELERLDQAGVPGVRLRDLLTLHTLDRLRRDEGRWGAAQETVRALAPADDWRRVLMALGYELERRPLRGYLVRFSGKPVAVVHPKADPAEFARLDTEGRPPEGAVLNDARSENVEFGLLAAGVRFRLFFFGAAGGSTSRYLDLDAAVMRPRDKPLMALLGPSYLAEGEFARLITDATGFGAELKKRLDKQIRFGAFPALARGLEAWARKTGLDLASEAQLTELERAALTLVFRLLFLLYAESSNYLPMENRSYNQASITNLIQEAEETREQLGARSTSLWDRTQLLVRAMRTGNPAWRVPAYNGALFAGDGFDGATTLERMTMSDPDFAEVLLALGRDPETGTGVDYSTLDIGHLGHIYEALLSLRLSVATRGLIYDARQDRFRPVLPGEQVEVATGSLLWITNEGGRKSGGVYYTRSELVRHLVRQAVLPAFERHLEEVRAEAERNPTAAARHLLSFAVVDPACGSAHFLVEVLDALADRLVSFLAQYPLPPIADSVGRLRAGALPGSAIDDSVLIRRLVLKHCVHGVDISPMGAEVAKLSLWLASFVPGLSLAYLDGNLKVGNSLIGVARTASVGASKYVPLEWTSSLKEAAHAAARAADIEDRNPDEVKESERAGADARAASRPVEKIFNLWTAEAFGVAGGRGEVNAFAADILAGRRESQLQTRADQAAVDNHFLHWPIAFPRVFTRDSPGFDAVVGNPPWEEIKAEELSFYGLFLPGLRGMSERDRLAAITRLTAEHPELVDRLRRAKEASAKQRHYLSQEGSAVMAGDPDLYKFFCQRYRALLRDGSALGVVLPRGAFVNDGSSAFREWLFTETTCKRIDFLLNNRLWMFETHPQYTVALLATEASRPNPDHPLRVAGAAKSLGEWNSQSTGPGVLLPQSALGPGSMVPLVRNDAEAELLARLRKGDPFPLGPRGRWKCYPVRELDETNDRPLWARATEGQPLWKGESFDQYDPHGAEARLCPMTDAVRRKIMKPRPGADSLVATKASLRERKGAVIRELGRARLAFRGITNRTNSRTILTCLVPRGVLLGNSAPYLAFVKGGPAEQAGCLAVMNSLSFDWQARRFAEVNINFFILEGLVVPHLSDEDFDAIAAAAARLSCVDERFAEFAAALGIDVHELSPEERQALRLEIDARISRAWNLSAEDLKLMLADFTYEAITQEYRERLVERLMGL